MFKTFEKSNSLLHLIATFANNFEHNLTTVRLGSLAEIETLGSARFHRPRLTVTCGLFTVNYRSLHCNKLRINVLECFQGDLSIRVRIRCTGRMDSG